MNLNKLFAAIIVAIIMMAMSPMLLVRLWPKINDVRTGETPQYPDLQPQRFAGRTAAEIFEQTLVVVREMDWEIREANRDQGVIEAVATVPVFRFRDDVTITITTQSSAGPGSPDSAAPDSAVIVNIRSRSRVGKSDLGENARRIRRFQTALAARIQN